jgi:tetratricopeptide (TPR) repeat protein
MSKILSFVIGFTLVSQAFAQSPPPSAESLYQKGLAAEKSGDPVAASEFYKNALKTDPNHANARYSIGQLRINAPAITAKAREAKFGAVMVPLFQLDEATIEDAVAQLCVIVGKESKTGVKPNFIIEDPKNVLADRKVSLNLKNIPAKAIMKYLTDQTSTKVRYDEHAIVITPR